MYSIVQVNKELLGQIIPHLKRHHFQYHEYPFLDTEQLASYFENKCIKILANEDSLTLAAFEGSRVLGMVSCEKNPFDSEIFGFTCYRIVDLVVLSDQIAEVRQVLSRLLIALESDMAKTSKPFYLAVSLNNNTPNMDYLFNALTANHYHYIHTLITFFAEKKRFDALEFYPKEKIKIRKAVANDADAVGDLAFRSFKYSRFHLDPFLDPNEASELLKTSALNSILLGFVDVMFIAEIDNRIVGYYSAKKRFIPEFKMTVGEAVISAVDEMYRGSGIFGKLDAHLLNWFADYSDFSEMGTYLANIPVHKTWINKGLRLIRGTHQFSKLISN